jgi:nitrogen fixation-related uncharacterized protein
MTPNLLPASVALAVLAMVLGLWSCAQGQQLN